MLVNITLSDKLIINTDTFHYDSHDQSCSFRRHVA